MKRRMETVDVWLAIVLLLLAGAGMTAGGTVEEGVTASPVEQAADAVVPTTDSSASSGPEVADPVPSLVERLVRLVAVNSLLTTQMPLDLP